MADSSLGYTQGSTNPVQIDTRTESNNGDHRQVVVLGDPVTGNNVTLVDPAGRLQVAQGGAAITSTAPVSVSATGTSYVTAVSNAGNATVFITPSTTTTLTSGNQIVFEISADNSNWVGTTVVRGDNGQTGTTGTISALANGQAMSFNIALLGANWLRVRTTTFSGAAFTITCDLGGGQFMPNVAVTGTANVSGTVALAAGTNAIGNVNIQAGPSISKGTQATNGFTTQDLKDAGRSSVTFYTSNIASVTTEALFSANYNRNGAFTSAVTENAVTSGKTLRLQGFSVSAKNGGTAPSAIQYVRFAIRTSYSSTAGSVSATSPILAQMELTLPSTAVGAGDRYYMEFPDGIELAAGLRWGVTHVSGGTTSVNGFHVVGFEY